ncbi:hypothetical protein R1flu_022585 [Riccia fluitans]|uniref:Uncharacterized protein n=1 Tax=Riccia fluitans TaxID=41844 RepID=A0ABD1XQ99_9MARC
MDARALLLLLLNSVTDLRLAAIETLTTEQNSSQGRTVEEEEMSDKFELVQGLSALVTSPRQVAISPDFVRLTQLFVYPVFDEGFVVINLLIQ